MTKKLPKSVHAGEIEIFGVTLKCHVLDNGQRVFEADGLEQLFAAAGCDSPTQIIETIPEEEAIKLANFIQGNNQDAI